MQSNNKKSGTAKPAVLKKADGGGPVKSSASIETEDVEVMCLQGVNISIYVMDSSCFYSNER